MKPLRTRGLLSPAGWLWLVALATWVVILVWLAFEVVG